MNYNEKIAAKIRSFRSEKGIKAEYLAYKFNMSKSAYSNLENGKTEITVNKLQLCSLAFNVPINQFFDENNEKPSGISEKYC